MPRPAPAAVLAAAVTTLATLATLVPAPTPATAAAPERGTTSLATSLAADKGFDRNWQDHDVFEYLLDFLLEADPTSPLAVLTQGEKRLTAFVPTDLAFARLLSPQDPKGQRERDVAEFIPAYLDNRETEAILLNHVVTGARLGATKVRAGDGRQLTTAQGDTVEITVGERGQVRVVLPARGLDARVVRFGLNRGNRQVGHAISEVLLPSSRGDSGRLAR